jgi:prevent-host-death family protein
VLEDRASGIDAPRPRAILVLAKIVKMTIMTITEVDMNESITVAQAKATLSECIRRVEAGRPLFITRHGKTVAALVRPDDVLQIERLRKVGPQSGLASIAGGWEDSEVLADILDVSSRRGSRDTTSVAP